MGNAVKNIEKAIIRTELIMLETYPFSDPSPVPEFGRLYPYNRFDGYTEKSSAQQWEMVVMENDYIKLWINPSVGGKIWGAIEKSTGKEFIYFNHSAKFRDVAMRGPWTSGGMEFNMGIIGHNPSCSAPVDYHYTENGDGSVSCFIGATDWPSRTEWRVEIHLAKDAAYFSTRSWWYNHNCLPQSYYQWSNLGIKASGNLEYVFPGNYRIGHDGSTLDWPKDEEGREISFYNQNDHGEYKSYHVAGSYADFWGCYWHDEKFGMGHSSSYDDKPGKKIWIWGLSRYGMIWEDLLTDSDGQYTEVQSGRLFNQSIASSSKTPFKHRSFSPYTLDSWEEHWFPVKDMGGLTYGDQHLSFYIEKTAQSQLINICANVPLDHLLSLHFEGQEIFSVQLELETLQQISIEIPPVHDPAMLKIFLNDSTIFNGPEQHEKLNRPTEIDPLYDFDSAQALCIQAKEWERQRFHERAIADYMRCLEKDPFFIEAMTGLAGLYLIHLKFNKALELLKVVLSIDTYNGEANYLYGLANDRLEHRADAKDGFSIASQAPEYRIPAFLELAKLFLRENQVEKALSYIKKAQQYHAGNLQVCYLNIIIHRLRGNYDGSASLAKLLLAADPISYLGKYEYGLATQVPALALTTSEMPYETYIELAIFYYRLNLYNDALNCLALAPEYGMVSLWKAFLYAKLDIEEQSLNAIENAALLSPDFVFPHREEDIQVLKWAVQQHESWKFKYYLALACIQNLDRDEALVLLERCGNEPEYYPFYKVRADLKRNTDENGRLADLESAFEQAPEEWRTGSDLSKYFSEKNHWMKAMEIARQTAKIHPENYYIALQLARCYMQTHNFEKGIALMQRMRVLPNEGASEGRNSWRETHLLSALNAIDHRNLEKAVYHISEARKWPENMGIGKPYHVDERLEDYMELICSEDGTEERKQDLIERIAQYRKQKYISPYGSADFISMVLLRATGDREAENTIVENWKKQDPDDLALKWANACMDGNREQIEKFSALVPHPKEAMPYEILFEDRPFPFVKQLFSRGMFKKFI